MKTILLYEDNSAIVDVTTLMLERMRCKVIHFKDCENILQEIRLHRPALVLLDLRLPGDGRVAIHRIKHDPSTANVPVVIFTAMLNISECVQKLADGILRKPFELEDLAGVINGLHSVEP